MIRVLKEIHAATGYMGIPGFLAYATFGSFWAAFGAAAAVALFRFSLIGLGKAELGNVVILESRIFRK